MDQFLLEESHPWLEQELVHWQEVAKGRARDGKETVWQADLIALLEKENLTWSSLQVPPQVGESPWFAALPKREQMLIGYKMAVHSGIHSLEVTQSIERALVSKGDVFNTFTGQNQIMLMPGHFPSFRLLSGYERLLMHGYDESFLKVATSYTQWRHRFIPSTTLGSEHRFGL